MRALTASLCLLALAACGPARRDDDRDRDTPTDTPDAAQVEPDGGTTEPDGGTTEPDGGTTEPDGGTVANGAPSTTLATPNAGSGDISVRILLFDAEADALSVTLEWDDQSGAGFRAATVRSATTNLASAPDGVEHTLTWGSATDLPNRQAEVRLRLTPRDTRAGPPAQTFPFAVDNRRPNTAPTLAWGAVPSTIRGDVVLSVTVSDAESDTVSLAVEYRVGGNAWAAATLATAPGSVTATPFGVQVPFTWSSAANVTGNASGVQLRARATDPQAASSWVETGAFAVQNGVSPPPNGVRVTEIHTAEDADWIEVTNFGSTPVDLRGWNVRWGREDDETGTAVIAAPSSNTGYVLAGGGRMLVTDEQGSTGNGTIYLSRTSQPQNISWGSGFPGFVELVDANGTAVDFVRWGGSTKQPSTGSWSEAPVLHVPHDGASLVRQGAVDRDSSTDFCAAPATKGATDTTPCYAAPPASTRVRLTEISPAGTNGAWVEIVNGGGAAIDLRDWSVHSMGLGGIGLAVLRPVTLSANGGRLVLRSGSGTDSSGTQYTGSASEIAIGGAAAVSLRDATGAPHDFVRWGAPAAPPPPITWSPSSLPAPTATNPLARTSESFSTLLATDVTAQKWCAAAAASPNAPSPGCRPPPVTTGVRLSEVVGGTTFFGGSAIEIENVSSGTTVQAADLQLVVDGSAATPLGGGTLGPGQRRSFDGCSVLTTTNCIAGMELIDFTGAVAIELQDITGRQLDFVRLGGSTVQPSSATGWSESTALPLPTGGGSIGRKPGTDTDSAADWCLQASTSLGAANAGCR